MNRSRADVFPFRQLVLTLFVPVAVCFTSIVGQAADLNRGKLAMFRGKDALALKELLPLAEADMVEAQLLVGRLYARQMFNFGLDTRELALKWLKRAADNGSMTAKAEHAKMVLRNPDASEAAKAAARMAMDEAVEAGVPYALYDRGYHLAQEYRSWREKSTVGFSMLERAAIGGYYPAYSSLAEQHLSAANSRRETPAKYREHMVESMKWLLLEYAVRDEYAHYVAKFIPESAKSDAGMRSEILRRTRDWLQKHKPDKLTRLPAKMPWETP